MGKGKPLPAIVEQVVNGSLLRVTLLPEFHSVSVTVCGTQVDRLRNKPCCGCETIFFNLQFQPNFW